MKVRLQFWDSPSNVQDLREASFASLHGALIAFDLSRASTFHNLDQWFNALKHFADISQVHAIFLVGMKADLSAEVSEAEALELAEKWSNELGKAIPYVRISSQNPSSGSISPAILLQRIAMDIANKMIAEPEDAAGLMAKVIILGEKATGKTGLISVLSGKGFQSAYMMTIGADFTLIDVNLPLEDMKRAPADHIPARRRIDATKVADEEAVEEKIILEPLARKSSAVASPTKEKMKKRAVLEEKKKEREEYLPPPPSPAPKPSPKPVETREPPPKPSAPPPSLRAPSGPPAAPPSSTPPPAPGGAPPPHPTESMPKAKKEAKRKLDAAEKEVAAPPVQPSEDLDSFQAIMGEGLDDMEAEEAVYEEPSEVSALAGLRAEAAIEPSPAALLSKPSEPTRFSKDCKVSYYDIMNPEKFYELLVHISDIPLDVQAPITSLLTGERRTEVKEHVEVITEEIPLVIVRPIFPGCLITPSEAEVDFREADKRLTFFVTPLVKGNIPNARVELYLHNKELIAAVPTSTKVVDPRIARVIAAMGFAVGLGPKAVEYGFDVDFNENLVKAMPFLDDLFGSIDFLLLLELSLLSFFLLLAAGLFIKYRPRSKEQEAKI